MIPQSFNQLCLLAALLLTVQLSVRSQDVAGVYLYRAAFYEQKSNSEPLPIPATADESPFLALAVMEMDSNFLSDPDNLLFVRAVTLQPPTGALRGMEFSEEFAGFYYSQTFANLAALENAYRSGNYRFVFGSAISGDSTYNLAVNEPSLPQPPRLVNFGAAQDIDPAKPFELQWTPAAPASGGAFVEVYDLADGSLVFDSEPILGAVTSATIPAGMLQTGHTYEAEIVFTQFDNVDRSASSAASTRVPLGTGSVTVPPPTINSITLNTEGGMVLVVQCTPGMPLNLQQTGTLGGAWETTQTVTPAASPATLIVPVASIGAVAFFQATQ